MNKWMNKSHCMLNTCASCTGPRVNKVLHTQCTENMLPKYLDREPSKRPKPPKPDITHLSIIISSNVPTLWAGPLHYLATKPIPAGCPWGEVGGQGRGICTKGPGTQTLWSESVTVQHWRQQKGMTDRQTDKQTDFFHIIVRLQRLVSRWVAITWLYY